MLLAIIVENFQRFSIFRGILKFNFRLQVLKFFNWPEGEIVGVETGKY
jgi:hypothetical protein